MLFKHIKNTSINYIFEMKENQYKLDAENDAKLLIIAISVKIIIKLLNGKLKVSVL